MAESEHEDKQVRRRRWQGFGLSWALSVQAVAAFGWIEHAPSAAQWMLALWMLAPWAFGAASFFLALGRERPLRDGAEGFLIGAFSILAAGVVIGILNSLMNSI